MLRKIVLGIGLIFWVLLHLLVVVFGEVEPGISLLLWFLILLVVVTAAYFEAINGASGPVVHATAFAILHVSNAIMALPDYISAPETWIITYTSGLLLAGPTLLITHVLPFYLVYYFVYFRTTTTTYSVVEKYETCGSDQ